MQLLQDRKYNVAQSAINVSFDDFKSQMEHLDTESVFAQMTFFCEPHREPNQTDDVSFNAILVKMVPGKLGKDDFEAVIKQMDSQNASRCIIITRLPLEKITPQFRDKIASYNQVQSGNKIELFEFRELLINVTEHNLVPQHIPLSKDQVKELLAQYKLTLRQLPRMQTTDPIAKYYGLSKGDVVKIIRQSETAGRYVTYRAVS